MACGGIKIDLTKCDFCGKTKDKSVRKHSIKPQKKELSNVSYKGRCDKEKCKFNRRSGIKNNDTPNEGSNLGSLFCLYGGNDTTVVWDPKSKKPLRKKNLVFGRYRRSPHETETLERKRNLFSWITQRKGYREKPEIENDPQKIYTTVGTNSYHRSGNRYFRRKKSRNAEGEIMGCPYEKYHKMARNQRIQSRKVSQPHKEDVAVGTDVANKLKPTKDSLIKQDKGTLKTKTMSITQKAEQVTKSVECNSQTLLKVNNDKIEKDMRQRALNEMKETVKLKRKQRKKQDILKVECCTLLTPLKDTTYQRSCSSCCCDCLKYCCFCILSPCLCLAWLPLLCCYGLIKMVLC